MNPYVPSFIALMICLTCLEGKLSAQWAPLPDNRVMPAQAFVAMGEKEQVPMYIARTTMGGQTQVGEMANGWLLPSMSSKPVLGSENGFYTPRYEIFTGHGVWVSGFGALFPPEAVVAGRDAKGANVYIARAKIGDRLHIGSVKMGESAMIQQQSISQFEVLVAASPPLQNPEPTKADLPCTATWIDVTPLGSKPKSFYLSLQGATLSAPADTCGLQYFGEQRVDRWFFFIMPKSGRVMLDFDQLTTSTLYTGSCEAISASGECQVDRGESRDFDFSFDFKAPVNTVVYLRVFGNVDAQRSLRLYEVDN